MEPVNQSAAETCPKCQGAKKIDCFFCDGKGRDPWNWEEDHRCSGCDGKGKLECSACNGTGLVIKTTSDDS